MTKDQVRSTEEALKLALEALEKSNGMLERADCSTGYCCCGSSVDGHTFGDGHSPVDEGEYYQGNALEYWNKAITAIKQALAAPVQEPVVTKTEKGVVLHVGWDDLPAGAKLYITPPAQEFVCSTGLCHYKVAAPVQEPDELKHIDEQDCLLDVDEKAWRSLVENRGGCRCHISPPCNACSNPISEEEMNEVGYTYATPPAQPAPVQELLTGLDIYLDPNDELKPKRYPAAQRQCEDDK